jgi:tungstate transport system substrate-binding protein
MLGLNIFFKITFYPIILFYSCLLLAQEVVIQSTTSTRDSGLYEHLLPKYPLYDNISIKVIAVGTGQAILNSKNCDGGILIVHDERREQLFMEEGFGSKRYALMFNDYVIIGPKKDKAKIFGSKSSEEVFTKIYNTKSKFISRSDSSGTHAMETKIWNNSKLNPIEYSGSWYLETGQGMGQSLNIAIATDAYILSDRSTWLKFQNKQNHKILYQNKIELKNQYGMILVNTNRCNNIDKEATIGLYNWLTSEDAQNLINDYLINNTQVFFSN